MVVRNYPICVSSFLSPVSFDVTPSNRNNIFRRNLPSSSILFERTQIPIVQGNHVHYQYPVEDSSDSQTE